MWASCTAPVSEHIASWGAMMGRLRRKFIAKLQALPKDDMLIDPVLKLTLVLCQYERVLQKSKPPKTQDHMNLLPNIFQQLAQTVARFYTVSGQLFGEIDQCINQIAIPLLRQDSRTPQDYSKLVIYIAKTASACEHHANENSLRSAWQLTAIMPELRSKWEVINKDASRLLVAILKSI
ncbi:hypothetical protein FRC12_012038 [Ceratobasidium sp. 428]|nr:hypothetical protein FRC12_012038 [Ceratobasidium sp. 428]